VLFWPKSSGCCCEEGCDPFHISVRLCQNFNPTIAEAGATVTAHDALGNLVDTGVSDAGGLLELDLPAAGEYTFTASNTGRTTLVVVEDAACGGSLEIVLGRTFNFSINGCSVAYRNVPVTLTHATSGRVYLATTTTSFGGFGTGNLTMAVGETGNYNYTMTADRHAVKTGTVASASLTCANAGGTHVLTPLSGYTCTQWSCATPAGLIQEDCWYPLAGTLFLTDSAFGAVTLTYGTVSTVGGWRGSKAVTSASGPATTAHYLLRDANVGAGTFQVSFDLGLGGGTQNLTGLPCGGSADPDEFCAGEDILETHPDLSNAAGVTQATRELLYGPTVPTFTVTE
jgi:hypothetical protein